MRTSDPFHIVLHPAKTFLIRDECIDLVSERRKVIAPNSDSLLEKMVTVSFLLAWDGVDDDQNQATRQCLRAGKSPRFAHQEV